MDSSFPPEDDEWENFSSFTLSAETDIWKNEITELNCTKVDDLNKFDNEESNSGIHYSDLLNYESLEDLVHSFEEKMASCFRIKNKDADISLPKLQPLTLDTFSHDKVWKTLTDNYGLVQPLNWRSSAIYNQFIPALGLSHHELNKTRLNEAYSKNKFNPSNNLDDIDLENQLDYHSMIAYNNYRENDECVDSEYIKRNADSFQIVQTADEVIEELEEMMQNAEEINAAINYEVQEETGIIFDENSNSANSDNCKIEFANITPRPSIGSLSSIEESIRASALKTMTVSQLNSTNEDLECQVSFLSTELLDELNKRDELNYEIEIKHSFISKVLEIQHKIEEFSKLSSVSVNKFSNLKKSATSDSVSTPGKYLTTVIPCTKGKVLTLDNLQSLIKILDAIKADSDEVPSLLTAYILQVVCPAPNEQHVLKL